MQGAFGEWTQAEPQGQGSSEAALVSGRKSAGCGQRGPEEQAFSIELSCDKSETDVWKEGRVCKKTSNRVEPASFMCGVREPGLLISGLHWRGHCSTWSRDAGGCALADA